MGESSPQRTYVFVRLSSVVPAAAGVKSRVLTTKLADWPRAGRVAASVVKAEHTIATKDSMERACILDGASVNVIWNEL